MIILLPVWGGLLNAHKDRRVDGLMMYAYLRDLSRDKDGEPLYMALERYVLGVLRPDADVLMRWCKKGGHRVYLKFNRDTEATSEIVEILERRLGFVFERPVYDVWQVESDVTLRNLSHAKRLQKMHPGEKVVVFDADVIPMYDEANNNYVTLLEFFADGFSRYDEKVFYKKLPELIESEIMRVLNSVLPSIRSGRKLKACLKHVASGRMADASTAAAKCTQVSVAKLNAAKRLEMIMENLERVRKILHGIPEKSVLLCDAESSKKVGVPEMDASKLPTMDAKTLKRLSGSGRGSDVHVFLDMDKTMIGETKYLIEADDDYCNGYDKGVCKRGIVTQQDAIKHNLESVRRGLIRPHLGTFIKFLQGRKNVKIHVFSAGVEEYVGRTIEGVEDILGVRFERPLYDRSYTRPGLRVKDLFHLFKTHVASKEIGGLVDEKFVYDHSTVLIDDIEHALAGRENKLLLVPGYTNQARFMIGSVRYLDMDMMNIWYRMEHDVVRRNVDRVWLDLRDAFREIMRKYDGVLVLTTETLAWVQEVVTARHEHRMQKFVHRKKCRVGYWVDRLKQVHTDLKKLATKF
jgi:DNA replication initiation complex subunit (GINS family)